MSEENEELLFGDSQPKKDFEPVDEQEYEFVIASFEYKTAGTGRQQLSFKLKIREDVEQKNKGRCVWYNISKRDDDGKAFNFYRINQLILSQKGTPDYKERFKDGLDEVLQYLVGRHLVGYVTVEDGNNGKPFNSIDGDTFGPSKWDKAHPAMTTDENGIQKQNTEALDSVADDDDSLPF